MKKKKNEKRPHKIFYNFDSMALIFLFFVSKETDFIQIKVVLGNWPSLDHLKVLFGHWLRFHSFSVQSLI